MAVLRTDIEKALDELKSQENGMRFQGLAVALGKQRWPELIARPRHKDFGLDAYAPATLTRERVGKGLAASTTPTLKKVCDDAKAAKGKFPDLQKLLFVTSSEVGNAKRDAWEQAIRKKYGLELHLIEREEVIAQMMMPENASLCASHLYLNINAEPALADLIAKTRRAASTVSGTWAAKTKGHPLIELTARRLDREGAESAEVLSLEDIDRALSQSRRVVLEGPPGRGKTTTLIQLSQRARASGTAFVVELPAWTSSRKSILHFISEMPQFETERLSAANLALVQQSEPFFFLLNGWNEITETNSTQANEALRELERNFPSAGIIVATRPHHLTPPLPGALRLRLMGLRRGQRDVYLTARLGGKATDLRERINGDASLDELTRSPFILSEVASLFEAGADIPNTKIGILAAVLRLQEEREEHRNALHIAPTFGRQRDYLQVLATEMTRRGGVSLSEAEARALVARVARDLFESGQIEEVGAPGILGSLTSHHTLVRVDYPEVAYQFEHQQVQEYYATLGIRARLLDLNDAADAIARFTSDYVNEPAWGEPLRMIAETLAEADEQNTRAGRRLVRMALTVDPVLAGELAQLCGEAVWKEVRAEVGERFRAIYALRDDNYRQLALAAMLATGAEDFSDIMVPLLSGQDEQTRHRTYRLAPDLQVTSLGPNWREQVRGWSDEARADFVSTLLHHRVDTDIAEFAAQDTSVAVKKAAVSGLKWIGSDDALARVLESMDAQTFEAVAREVPDRMPPSLRPKAVATMRRFVEITTDHPAKLRTALDLIELGETGLDQIVKDAMAALARDDMRNLGSHYIQPALEYLHKTDAVWTSEWIAIQVGNGTLYPPEHWLAFATAIPAAVVDNYLHRLETENLKNARFNGMTEVIAAAADATLATLVFTKLRELRRKVEAEPDIRHEYEQQIIDQLEAVFRAFADDVAVGGILGSVTPGEPVDIKVAVKVLSRVGSGTLDSAPLQLENEDTKRRLRDYLKASVDVVLRTDSFGPEQVANLSGSIARLGHVEDMADIVRLMRRDLEKLRENRGVGYGNWHLEAAMQLGAGDADQVLADLLSEPEYAWILAERIGREFLPKPERAFDRTIRHDLMWAARDGRLSPPADASRRLRFATALTEEIERLLAERIGAKDTGGIDVRLAHLASALAAVDSAGSNTIVLDAISLSDRSDEYRQVEAAERLLVGGVVLPTAVVFRLLDTFVARTEKWMQDSDKYLLKRILVLCAFVDEPEKGIARMRDVLAKKQLYGYELGEIVTALGESRCDAAVDLLTELAADATTFEQCEDNFINAFATLDTARAREFLVGLVDPESNSGVVLKSRPFRGDVLVARLAELAQRVPVVAARLRGLCERDLPGLNRDVISKVLYWLGTPEDLTASLILIDDSKPIPQGAWNQLRAAFVERRSHGQDTNIFSEHARASNELRRRLFLMAFEDERRRKSAFALLGQIEEWRLEHGRPVGEPRHPDLASGRPWPPEAS